MSRRHSFPALAQANTGSSRRLPIKVDVRWEPRGWVAYNPHIDADGNDADPELGVVAEAYNVGAKTLASRIMARGDDSLEGANWSVDEMRDLFAFEFKWERRS